MIAIRETYEMNPMNETIKNNVRLEIIIKYLKKKIPRLDDIVFDLGFFTFDELVKCALKDKENISYGDAEKLVLAFILKSLGSEPINDRIQDMRNQIVSIYETRDFLVNILKKNRLKTSSATLV